jgi:uncharacterized integral membrane protein (TIGR00697 family)
METTGFWLFWLAGLAVSTILGAYIVKNYRERGLYILGTMLAIYVVGANILVPRLVNFNIFGMSFVLVTGSIIWPYTAQLSDMINEIYGKKSAYFAAFLSYLSNLMFVGFVLMAFNLKPLDPTAEPFFQSFFGVAARVVLASICSYTAANLVDINIFSAIKKWASSREASAWNLLGYSSLRSALSDGANMVVDNIVFYSIAFYGTMPNDVLFSIIGSSMLAKVIMSQIDLPFYWIFRLMTREVKREF